MKLSVLLLFGGESSEHDVSLASARNIYDAIDKNTYDVTLGYISRDGRNWQHVESFDNLNGTAMVPLLGQQKIQVGDNEITVDVLFPVLHGAHGEDGDVQGLARLLHVPCVGPSLIGAAVTMDKDVTKRLLRDAGVPVVDWFMWHTSVPAPAFEDIIAMLGDVVFVKPANAGSSVGVSRVTTAAEYDEALKLASEHDSLVLIEQGITAREIEVAVLGNGADLSISSLGEIVPGEAFYSYDDKYSDTSTSRAIIPAELSAEQQQAIQKFARIAYLATRGNGMARIDFFVSHRGDIFLNEINAIPGFTNISMYPKLWQHEGKSYSQLISELIQLAVKE